jgi:hypothetical protein
MHWLLALELLIGRTTLYGCWQCLDGHHVGWQQNLTSQFTMSW